MDVAGTADRIVIAYTADVVQFRFHSQLRNAPAVDVSCFAVHMLGIFYASLDFIPRGTPQAADDGDGNAQVLSQLISNANQLLLGFCREAVAVFSTALAAELFSFEILDFIPE